MDYNQGNNIVLSINSHLLQIIVDWLSDAIILMQ